MYYLNSRTTTSSPVFPCLFVCASHPRTIFSFLSSSRLISVLTDSQVHPSAALQVGEEAGEEASDDGEQLGSEQLRNVYCVRCPPEEGNVTHDPLTSGIMYIQAPSLLEVSPASLVKMDYNGSFYSYGSDSKPCSRYRLDIWSRAIDEHNCLSVQYLILSTFVYGPANNTRVYHIIFHCPCLPLSRWRTSTCIYWRQQGETMSSCREQIMARNFYIRLLL
jgi:hypothetical protein